MERFRGKMTETCKENQKLFYETIIINMKQNEKATQKGKK